jgi:hypothetical protein
MKNLGIGIAILGGIPLFLWLASKWIDFWINRSIGQWMAFGVGLPTAFGVFLIWLVDILFKAFDHGAW